MSYDFLRVELVRYAIGCAVAGCAFLGCGDSGDSSGTSSSTYTLENVCDLVAPKVCELREPCCTATGSGFDRAKCEADFKSKCADDVSAVNAGDETFDPSGLDACLEKLPEVFSKCTLTLTDLQTIPLDLKVCNAFAGKKGEGAACTRSSECTRSGDANAWVTCSEQTKQCTKATIARLGDGCDVTKSTLCDVGLYCDAPALATAGTCKAATATGAACQRPAVGNPECGIGYYCDGASTTCTEAKAARETCTLPGECASGKCDGGTCAVGAPFVTAAECGK